MNVPLTNPNIERFFIFFQPLLEKGWKKAFQLLFPVRKMASNTTELLNRYLLNTYYVQYTVPGPINNNETNNIPIHFSFINSFGHFTCVSSGICNCPTQIYN